ncbi:MAG: hypothetical protein CO170_01250 [candidate division SR1 bacterium CG_4_9_14_3_um_filter_40_9]|nr:MAG: hypothetical protein CO170_01250 [candidate division SR1 bacterium CG_4_9_14_3_um_filter_40_9]
MINVKFQCTSDSQKKGEEKKLSLIVKKNYSPFYAGLACKEIGAAFKDFPIKPKYFVAEEKGEIRGFAGFMASRIDYCVYDICRVNVEPKYQGQGIGSQLIKKIIKTIKSYQGIHKASMVMLTACKPKFYEKFGFKTVSRYKRDDCLMVLKISK